MKPPSQKPRDREVTTEVALFSLGPLFQSGSFSENAEGRYFLEKINFKNVTKHSRKTFKGNAYFLNSHSDPIRHVMKAPICTMKTRRQRS